MRQSNLFIRRSAVFSPCRTWRYQLWRHWDESKPYVNFICLNPSDADEEDDDMTSIRVVDYSQQWGFGSSVITNLFAFATPKPKMMKQAADPVGPDNDRWLRETARGAGLVVAAWGAHGTFLCRDQAVLRLVNRPLHYLTLTSAGHPHHPLRLPKELTPQRWAA